MLSLITCTKLQVHKVQNLTENIYTDPMVGSSKNWGSLKGPISVAHVGLITFLLKKRLRRGV